MRHEQCERCNSEASVRLESVGAWLCASCATTVSRRRRATRRRHASLALQGTPPLSIRRVDYRYVANPRLP
jgi:hypothetical protein